MCMQKAAACGLYGGSCCRKGWERLCPYYVAYHIALKFGRSKNLRIAIVVCFVEIILRIFC